MKKLILLLLSTFVHADDHNHFTIGCVDKIKNKYQIALDIDTKKFIVLKRLVICWDCQEIFRIL